MPALFCPLVYTREKLHQPMYKKLKIYIMKQRTRRAIALRQHADLKRRRLEKEAAQQEMAEINSMKLDKIKTELMDLDLKLLILRQDKKFLFNRFKHLANEEAKMKERMKTEVVGGASTSGAGATDPLISNVQINSSLDDPLAFHRHLQDPRSQALAGTPAAAPNSSMNIFHPSMGIPSTGGVLLFSGSTSGSNAAEVQSNRQNALNALHHQQQQQQQQQSQQHGASRQILVPNNPAASLQSVASSSLLHRPQGPPPTSLNTAVPIGQANANALHQAAAFHLLQQQQQQGLSNLIAAANASSQSGSSQQPSALDSNALAAALVSLNPQYFAAQRNFPSSQSAGKLMNVGPPHLKTMPLNLSAPTSYRGSITTGQSAQQIHQIQQKLVAQVTADQQQQQHQQQLLSGGGPSSFFVPGGKPSTPQMQQQANRMTAVLLQPYHHAVGSRTTVQADGSIIGRPTGSQGGGGFAYMQYGPPRSDLGGPNNSSSNKP